MARQRPTFDVEESARAVADKTSNPDLAWTVEGTGDRMGFVVDLGLLATISGHPHPLTRTLGSPDASAKAAVKRSGKAFHQGLTLAIAPSVQEWSRQRTGRTVSESLTCFRVFLEFLAETPYPVPPAERPKDLLSALYLQLFGEDIGLLYSEWLRLRSVGTKRRGSLYSAAKAILERATGILMWRPSPFAKDERVAEFEKDDKAYPDKMLAALNKRLRDIIRRKIDKRAKAIKNLSNDTRDAFLGQLRNGDSFSGDDVIGFAQNVLGDEVFASASCLLVLESIGCNEQPLLDIRPNRWSYLNPYDAESRLILMHKMRRGGEGRRVPDARITRLPPLRVIIPSKAKPAFHAYRLLRQYELTSKLTRSKLSRHADSLPEGIQKQQAKVTSSKFWVYVDDDGQIRKLTSHRTHSLFNKLFAKLAETEPLLLKQDGTPYRYYAKEFRNAYFKFSSSETSFDGGAAEVGLSHAIESRATAAYLKKSWARKYVRTELRRFQDNVFSLLHDANQDLSPRALRKGFKTDSKRDLSKHVSVPKKLAKNQVAHGFFCHDPKAPPAEVHVLKNEEVFCPAEQCWDCPWARCFDESLPELAFDIFVLRIQVEEVASHALAGSFLKDLLEALEELFSRWPFEKRLAAMEAAKAMPSPYWSNE